MLVSGGDSGNLLLSRLRVDLSGLEKLSLL